MGMEDIGKIKRRLDGSVDTDHYTAMARRLRGAATRRWLQDLADGLFRRRASGAGKAARGK